MNKQILFGTVSFALFTLAVIFAHISAACVMGGLSFFYAMWCLAFSFAAILTGIVAAGGKL